MSTMHIWWIRRDIRLQDNLALDAAGAQADHVIPVFILEPGLLARAAPKRRTFLLRALADLDRQLRTRGSRLIVRQGPAEAALPALVHETGAAQVFAHEDYSPYAQARDKAVASQVHLTLLPGVVLRSPEEILKSDGAPYTIFTPYKRQWSRRDLPLPVDILSAPEHLPPLPPGLPSMRLPEADPAPGFPATAAEAQSRLEQFARQGLHRYASERDRLDLDGTSRLSPYLRFGLVSARECFARAQWAFLQAGSPAERVEIQSWMDELVWREFFTMILKQHPHVVNGPFRKEYQAIPWRDAPEDLRAWQKGQTGFPAVDACMRQMLSTGWMHNRGRMIVASFLTKDLLINWQEGEAFFMQHLVDGDLAANNGGWQWTAGTGTDAAPYFRIFNPILQGQKFDPDGNFIARWVPELGKLPPKFRHEPWKLSPSQAQAHHFRIGRDYPDRIVDRSLARQRTLKAYQFARNTVQGD